MKRKRRMFLLPIFLLSAGLSLSSGVSAADKATIANGVWLGDQDLSGMTLAEASSAMDKYLQKISTSDLTIKIRGLYPEAEAPEGETPEALTPETETAPAENPAAKTDITQAEVLHTVTVPISEFGLSWSVSDSLMEASSLGQTGKLIERYKLLSDLKYSKAQLPLKYSIDEAAVKAYVENVLVPEYSLAPVNADCTVKDKKIVLTRESSPGMEIDPEQACQAIIQCFNDGLSTTMSVNVPAWCAEPECTTEMIQAMDSVIGTFYTNFESSGDNANRAKNIRCAADHANGTLVLPGEKVSVDVLFTMRTEANGYVEGNSFLNGQVVKSLGGGICQVSTTLYRALLQAEIQIDERHNHSMVISYVPFSQDATIDHGNKDLKFTNNLEYPIYIEAITTGSQITFNIYGHEYRPSNRLVYYRTKVLKEERPDPRYSIDNSTAPSSNYVLKGDTHAEAEATLTKFVEVNGTKVEETVINHDYYSPSTQTVIIGGKGLDLKIINGVPCTSDGYKLLISGDVPIYNQAFKNYYSEKDSHLDANGRVVYTGPATPETSPEETSPEETLPEESSPEETLPTDPSSDAPSTEPTQPTDPTDPTQPTQPSTEPTQPTQPSSEPTTAAKAPNAVYNDGSASPSVVIGNTVQLAIRADHGTVQYSSSNTGVATVDASGKITAVAAGTAVITFKVDGTDTYEGASSSLTVTVTPPQKAPNAVYNDSGSPSIVKGNTLQLSIRADHGTVLYSSANTAVATVDASGKVTAVAAGTAVITFKVEGTDAYEGASSTLTVTVTEPAPPTEPQSEPPAEPQPEPPAEGGGEGSGT